MICTVTLNPAIDYVLTLPAPHPGVGGVPCRAKTTTLLPGGKGVNVSLMLHRLGVESLPFGLCAGKTGSLILESLRDAGLAPDFVLSHPQGGPDVWTRVNIKTSTPGQGGQEINAPGAPLPDGVLNALSDTLASRVHPGDTLVLAGSLPPGAADDIYAALLDRLAGRDLRVVVDTTGARLLATLPYHPFLIKPNKAELEELTGRTLTDDASVVRAARELQRQGAGHVLVSLGDDGCLLVPSPLPIHNQASRDDGHLAGACLRMGAIPPGFVSPTTDGTFSDAYTLRSPTGAGDSMVAGFLCGLTRGWHAEQVLRLATACGAATAFSDGLGRRRDVDILYAYAALCRETQCVRLPY